MSLFKKRVTPIEFADGLWISTSHATKNFTKHYWIDFEKENGYKLPPETNFENFAAEALILHFWIAGKALGTRQQASLDLLFKDIAKFLLLESHVDNPESLIMERFRQYHGLMDKKNLQELGYQICENLYGIDMTDFLVLDAKAVFILPMGLITWITHTMDAFLKIEKEFKIVN